jgi:hypothetical protein
MSSGTANPKIAMLDDTLESARATGFRRCKPWRHVIAQSDAATWSRRTSFRRRFKREAHSGEAEQHIGVHV